MSELNTAISAPMDMTDYKSVSSVKTSRVSIQPENVNSVTLMGGNTSDVYFSIPSKPNSVIAPHQTYLNFTYRFTGTAEAGKTASISNGTGASFIRNLETIAGSTSLELIQDYNALACLVDDFQSGNRKTKLGSILEDASPTVSKSGFSRGIGTDAEGGYTEKRRICIPLMSCALGTLADKYFPALDVGLRLRLTFEDPLIALVSNLTTPANLGYILEDLTLECEYLESDPATFNAIVQEAGNVLKVSGSGVSSFSTTIQAGSTKNTILIPARYSSVRNLFTTFRLSADVGSTSAGAKNSTGCRVRDNIEQYQYRTHGKPYPNLPVSVDAYTGAEVMSEVLKAFHSLHNTAQDVVVGSTYFTQNDSSDKRGSFVIAIDYEEAGFSPMSMSGLDTNSGNTFLELTHSSACSDLTVNTFAFYDTIIEINVATGEVMVSK